MQWLKEVDKAVRKVMERNVTEGQKRPLIELDASFNGNKAYQTRYQQGLEALTQHFKGNCIQ
jgi:hypothetical protein